MEVHRQHCQRCQSVDVHDVLVREPGEPQTVYVICADCHSLVARYRLADYYHHGKGAESFLRSRGGRSMESGRELLNDFEGARDEALAGYARVLTALADQHKPLDASGFPGSRAAAAEAADDDTDVEHGTPGGDSPDGP